ncbi:effector-associated constant component EACC1 [Nocardia arthritidis]|uniref:effector-associated constant component EACC1 n=1 Tax=Nocardia arthritidis TaxID=228602 RepID=UPI000A6F4473|nr:hypothetical protein [Nocardia arthritidis]
MQGWFALAGAGSLSTWLSQRHSDIELMVDDRDGRRVELKARRVRDVPELLDQVARMLDEAQASQTLCWTKRR